MSELIFVTGASGFVASHIIHDLSEQGYRVRGTARGKKIAALRELYKSSPNIEIVEVADIAYDQFEDALKGVDAVIHTASPLPGRAPVDIMLKTAVEGSLNVLRQAEKVGVKKFIVTSSIAAIFGDPTAKGWAFRPEHWSPVTKEMATADNRPAGYAFAKKSAELAVWEWADAHPHVDVTTINPPFLYGAFAPRALPVAPGDFNALSTNLIIYNLLTPSGTYPPRPGYANIRDAARAHVGALRTPANVQGRKRVIFASPDGVVFKDVLEFIRKERPEVEGRLINPPTPVFPSDRYDVDFARIEEVTGLKKEDFHTTSQTFLEAVDAVLQVEKEWKEAGYVVNLSKIPVMTS